MTGSKDEQDLFGSWQLVAFQEVGPNGTRDLMGPKVDGRLQYDAGGNMSAALVNMDRANLTSGDWQKATTDEKVRLFGTYMGYFGKYTVDPAKRTVTHQIAAGFLPSLTDSIQVRHYQLEGDNLFLKSKSGENETHVTWRRVK